MGKERGVEMHMDFEGLWGGGGGKKWLEPRNQFLVLIINCFFLKIIAMEVILYFLHPETSLYPTLSLTLSFFVHTACSNVNSYCLKSQKINLIW